MEIIIHRGTHQIGGCATEIRTSQSRIIIDFGEELDSQKKINFEIDGVTNDKIKCDAILFTHYHNDHVGLLNTINNKVHLFIGKLSKEILLISKNKFDFTQLQRMETFEGGKPFTIGDIKITPIMVDHSAFDAHMFLIEAENKRILFTGDFRNHGFRGKALIKVLDKIIKKVDVLICEGTVLKENIPKNMSEHDLSEKAKLLLNKNKYVFVVCASTNIDRLAAFSFAVPRGKYLLCDKYQKNILSVISKNTKKYTDAYQFPKVLTYGKNLKEKMKKQGFCMFVRLQNSFHKALMEEFKEKDPLVIYSMWNGYLEKNDVSKYLDGFRMEKLHTSGHADFSALSLVIQKTRPDKIIPIHTEFPEKFKELFAESTVLLVNDKEVITLCKNIL